MFAMEKEKLAKDLNGNIYKISGSPPQLFAGWEMYMQNLSIKKELIERFFLF